MRRGVILALGALVASACGGDLRAAAPVCTATEILAIEAQAVPTAEEIPCLEEVPFGWRVTTFDAETGAATFHLSHELAGKDAVVVTLTDRCTTADGQHVSLAPGEDQERVATQTSERFQAERFAAIEGGCITTRLDMGSEAWGGALETVDPVLLTLPRTELAERLREESGGALDLDRLQDADTAGS